MNLRWQTEGYGMATGLVLVFVCLTGCDIDSAESGARNVGLRIGGFYQHSDPEDFLVQQTSGEPISSLNLRQAGDQLEAIDSNGIVFNGTIGRVIDTHSATFNVDGRSTSGADATISGTITVDGASAVMLGTWIEPTLTSPVFGVATIPTNTVSSASTNTTDVSSSPDRGDDTGSDLPPLPGLP